MTEQKPNEPELCAGCGLPAMHKMCVAYGTDAYMNSEHPAWGNVSAIVGLLIAKEQTEQSDHVTALKKTIALLEDEVAEQKAMKVSQREIASAWWTWAAKELSDDTGVPGDDSPEELRRKLSVVLSGQRIDPVTGEPIAKEEA